MRKFYAGIGLILAFQAAGAALCAQQTVGVFLHDTLAQPGYTLFAPNGYTTTFLIDNCGRVIHEWQSQYSPGQSVYLLEDGSILRPARIGNPVFGGGGSGGKVERIDWDGTVVWDYNYSDSLHQQHHDIEPMPNGNVLILARERITAAQAEAMGRNPAQLNANGLWLEHVVEVQPTGLNTGNIVWEWHVKDHLVQDFDNAKPGYGLPEDHPERIDMNYSGAGAQVSDWHHANAVDYNPVTDQIMLSLRSNNEFWIIDHSTTTAEAASTAGGNSGKGGDLLYRWGNPAAYSRGTTADQRLFRQHDCQWIPQGYPGAGNVMVYNNGTDRPAGDYSTADEIVLPCDAQGIFPALATGSAWSPAAPAWSWQAPVPTDFYSAFISGVQRLPNGNTLICEGNQGHFFEVDSAGAVHWDYISPINGTGPVSQGSLPGVNSVFRCTRYMPDYAAFAGRTLTPGDPLELNPLPLICPTLTATPAPETTRLRARNTLVETRLLLDNPAQQDFRWELLSLQGTVILHGQSRQALTEIDLNSLPAGAWLLQLSVPESHIISVQKLLKL